MKKFILMAAAAVTLTACEKAIFDEETEDPTEQTSEAKTKKFTFTMKGDFSDEWKPVTRAAGYLSADGKDLTDLWVLDYQDGTLLQQIHQADNTADDFGRPTMNLTYGSHHIYFIASRGTGATLDTDAKTITFDKVLDTFYKDYEVSVVSTSNGNRAVTLDRCVTKLRLIFTDEVPTGAATINITPHTWYYGLNYQTGAPCAARTDYTKTIDVSQYAGTTNANAVIFSFSTADEWHTDLQLNSKNTAGTVLGSATITDAPFKANRTTEYTGPLFSAGGALSLSLNSTWEDPVTGTW